MNYPNLDQLEQFKNQVESWSSDFEEKLTEVVEIANKAKDEKLKQEEQKKQEDQKASAVDVKGKDWSHEEIQLLTKGIVKFPPGTGDRWRVIAGFVGSKNQKEVIAKAKEI